MSRNYTGKNVWVERDYAKEQRENIEFLTEGYRKFLTLCKNEGISLFQQYDEKHRVHYNSASWMRKFADLLDEFHEQFLLNNTYEPLQDEVGRLLQLCDKN